jgi:hypothetical protein
MRRDYFLGLISVLIFLGMHTTAFAFSDPEADNIGPVDLTYANAEVYDRGDMTLLKITIESTPHLPGVVIFECDVDNSTGTGGTLSMLGTPVPPCPCKTEAGVDIVVTIFLRQQGNNSGSSVCAGCSDLQGDCAQGRKPGQWFAMTSVSGQPTRNIGVLSGDLDPFPESPSSGENDDCYTLPWGLIIAYANQHLQEIEDPKRFNYTKARANDYGDGKWQVSLWHDEDFSDKDDIADNYPPGDYFNISDWGPDSGKADMVVSGGATDRTYCEGNFDGDADIDGSDAATMKANFGRTYFKNPCPRCGPHY